VQAPNSQNACINLYTPCGPDGTTIVNSVHDCNIVAPVQFPNWVGIGACHIQGGYCAAVTNNTLLTYAVATFQGGLNGNSKHQDDWQNTSACNLRFANNEVVNCGYIGVFMEPSGATCSNVWIENNVFCYEGWTNAAGFAGQNDMAIVFAGQGACVFSNIVVANNTCVDFLSDDAATIGLNPDNEGSQTFNGCLVANNLLWNCRKQGGNAPLAIQGTLVNVSMLYNYAGAGNDGSGGFVPNQTVAPNGCTVSDSCTLTPQFRSYSEFAINNDFHLASGDTACIGAGTNLNALGLPGLNTDMDGTPRPTSGPWDIGAYQH
jgi:hypothetical protein